MSSRTQSPTGGGGIGNELSFPDFRPRDDREATRQSSSAADWRADANAPQGGDVVSTGAGPKIVYGASRNLSLTAVTEARIRSCSGLQLSEGRIVLNHSAPWRPTRPIDRAESCQVLVHADTADNW